MAHGLCKFCHGYGNCMTIQNGRYEWRTCPFCLGHGERNDFRGPATIKVHAPRGTGGRPE